MRIFNYQYGLLGIGGEKHHLSVHFAGACLPGWKSFYDNKPPWKKWFKNPIFHNRGGWNDLLQRDRHWFIFLWFIWQW